jgi:hypothetical protein
MAAVPWVVAALIIIIGYAVYLGRHLKIGLKIPLATFFFETDSGPKDDGHQPKQP